MTDAARHCPNCGHSLLGITSSEEVASCPNCGMFFDRYRAAGPSRWPAVWKLSLALCGPMLLVVLMRAGEWYALRVDQKVLYRVLSEASYFLYPLAWFAWPILAAFLLARRFAPFPERWMTGIGLTAAGLVGNTALNLAALLVQAVAGAQ